MLLRMRVYTVLFLNLLSIKMQKKRLNIILILAVLGLWGSVIYKSLNRFFPSENYNSKNLNSIQSFDIKKITKDTFSLQKLSRDPFLDKPLVSEKPNNVVVQKALSQIKKTNHTVPTVSKPALVWPQVSYYGYIKSQQKIEELVLVKIDNRFLKVRKNQNVDGLIIKRIFKDSIEIGFNKEKKVIYKVK